ncbi:MAG: aminotransferase class V-fold PLP-dependent enzyme, partial [Rhodospirillales bacterium]|nr:aminotransferase class V-fold PLP-dependent enzyme [Rhodospirillales bacterium]
KVTVDVKALGVDMVSLSAHKLGGPQGIGALAMPCDGLELTPLIGGGGQERGRRAGTENVPGIVGFGVAARDAAVGLDHLALWRDTLEKKAQAVRPACRILGAGAPRLPNTSCLALPGLSGEVLVMALDLAGVAVSAGSACSSGKVAPSHVLKVMGHAALAGAAIRISLGWNSRAGDVDRFIEAWSAVAARAARDRSAASAA